MATYLTSQGLLPPNLQQILTQIENINWVTFGNELNQLPSSVMGQLNGVYANGAAQVWQDVSNVWTNWNPAMAGGVSLDNVVSVNGIKRLPATFGTGFLTFFGTLATVIPAFGLTASVSGSPSTQFQNTIGGTIGAGTNAVQTLTFSDTPDAGQFTLVWNGFETGVLNFNATNGNIQTALNALTGLTGASVAGAFPAFTVTFTGANGSQPVSILAIGTNTLTATAVPVSCDIAQTVAGLLPNVTLPIQCLTTGDLPAYAGTITVIVVPVTGVASVSNEFDITVGDNIETDPHLRVRRYESVSFPGSSNPDAMLSVVKNVTGVVNANIDNNTSLITNGNNTPGKAFQVIVLGGDDQKIADAIWSRIPDGIESYGTTTKTITDASGNPQTVKFTRPTPVPIYVIATFQSLSDYPDGVEMAGTLAITSGTKSVVGTDTTFTTSLREGQSFFIEDGIHSQWMTVDTITDDLNLAVVANALQSYTLGTATPALGDIAFQKAIADYGDATFSVGDNVIAWMLNLAAAGIPGIDNLTFTLGTAINPGADVDIPITALQISTWDTGVNGGGHPFISIVHF